VKGITVGNEVAFGPDDTEPLLGAPAMQAANLVWDARRKELVLSERLKPLKQRRLPAARPPTAGVDRPPPSWLSSASMTALVRPPDGCSSRHRTGPPKSQLNP
jgi:hypothetical protein